MVAGGAGRHSVEQNQHQSRGRLAGITLQFDELGRVRSRCVRIDLIDDEPRCGVGAASRPNQDAGSIRKQLHS